MAGRAEDLKLLGGSGVLYLRGVSSGVVQCGVYNMVGWDVCGVYGCGCDMGFGGVAQTGEAYVAWRAFWR